MKKIIIKFFAVIITLIFSLGTLFSLPKISDKIIVEKGNGGILGYNNVNEWHFYDDNCKCQVHKLSCWNPGYTSCSWVHRPMVMRLVDYAEEQIKQGNLKGNYEETIDGLRHVVEWDATDIYNVKITESVYSNEPE